ncbi:MAG TPA: DUF192 domain-containing protein, partial [Turneriella sp.]|nr:DUF192 domain-containing protein [Turneriella sp.]
ILVTMVLSGALPAQRPDSWEKERANAEAPTGKRGPEPAGDLAKPLDEVWRIVFHNSKGKDIVLDCEVARTEKEKERGLMFRKFLGKNRGMIFVYNQPDQMNFWMQNTLIPLSIAYVHEKLFIASIHDMKPLSLDIVSSDIPVLYAIEANVGWFKNNHILSGNRITIYKNPADYKVETKSKYRQEVPTP